MDPLKRIYRAKRKALIGIQGELDELADCLHYIAEFVKRWDEILLPTETKELNLLQNLGYADPIELNLKDWIGHPAFFETLALWRAARREAQDAYDAILDHEGVEDLPQSPSQRPSKPYIGRPRRPPPRGGSKKRRLVPGTRSMSRRR